MDNAGQNNIPQTPVQPTIPTQPQAPAQTPSTPLPSSSPTTGMPPESKGSFKTIFIILGLFVIIAVLGVIVYMKMINTNKSSPGMYQNPTSRNLVPTRMQQPSSPTSDAQIDKDTQDIDTTLSSLDSDLNSIDQGLNDKQTDLSQ